MKMVIIEEFRRCAVEWKNSAERLCEDIAGIGMFIFSSRHIRKVQITD